MKTVIQKFFNLNGYQIRKYPPPFEIDIQRRMQLIRNFNINKILDVGANKGQYASAMRTFGYTGDIISFEPLKYEFSKLLESSAADSRWEAVNIALGDEEKETDINIAGNSISSSILDMLPTHIESAPHSAYIGKERIKITTLDSIFFSFCKENDRVLLKVDTQGFERNVLSGAERSLQNIIGIQIEMSLVPLYSDGVLLREMIDYLESRNFSLFSLENGFWDRNTGRLLQVDGIFYKSG
jgi:FkbM family methyltransferase